MKILLVHKFFKYSGGADVFFFETGRVLEERGHQVAYFSTQDKDNLPSKWSSYFPAAPDFRSKSAVIKVKALAKILYNRDAKKRFARLLDDFQPDLIHVFNIMSQISPSILIPAKHRNIPVVISLNDYKHICPNYKLYRKGEICEKCKGGKFYHCLLDKCSHNSFSYSFASMLEAYVHEQMKIYENYISLFLFSSDFMAEKTEYFWDRKLLRGKLMNPFSVSEHRPIQTKGEFGLYFGRLIDEKGVDILLKALIVAKDVPFKIIGKGPDLEFLKAFASDHHLSNVEFLGPKWGNELNEYLDKAKFVVVPSIWHENFPYVILQAFDAGKPVIASRRGGMPEMVSEDRGMLYEAEDYQTLARLMQELNTDAEKCAEMGKNARQYVETSFNDDRFYDDLITNYDKVLQLKQKP